MNITERVSGSWNGVYVAAYVTLFDGIFYGYAKLFANEPQDMWIERPVLKLGTKGFDTLAAVLEEAERRGKGAAAELRAPATEGVW